MGPEPTGRGLTVLPFRTYSGFCTMVYLSGDSRSSILSQYCHLVAMVVLGVQSVAAMGLLVLLERLLDDHRNYQVVLKFYGGAVEFG